MSERREEPESTDEVPMVPEHTDERQPLKRPVRHHFDEEPSGTFRIPRV